MPAPAKPKASQADVLLHETQTMLAPLARMLVAHGVTYPQIAQTLKSVFLEAARTELTEAGKPLTDSALSLLSGVHRKDVRALAGKSERVAERAIRDLSFAAEVSTHWASDRKYTDARGKPMPLLLRGAGHSGPSFESLVRSVSKDFHPRSVVNELVRLGVAEVIDDYVHLKTSAFIPHEGFRELAYYFGANLHDHLAAAAANLRTSGSTRNAPFMEHAMYADELSKESVAKLQKLAHRLWTSAVGKMMKSALTAVEVDRDKPPAERGSRMRFGAYYYSEPGAQVESMTKRTRKGRTK